MNFSSNEEQGWNQTLMSRWEAVVGLSSEIRLDSHRYMPGRGRPNHSFPFEVTGQPWRITVRFKDDYEPVNFEVKFHFKVRFEEDYNTV